MKLISLTVKTRRGVPVNQTQIIDVDDIGSPITAVAAGADSSFLLREYKKGPFANFTDRALCETYVVDETLAQIAAAAGYIFTANILTYKERAVVGTPLMGFNAKMISARIIPYNGGSKFFYQEDSDPDLVEYTCTQTPAQILAQITSGTSTVWGTITGTLSNQLDLQAALDAKLNGITDITHAGLLALYNAGTMVEGYYRITDRADGGIILKANSPTSIDTFGAGIFYNADYQLNGDYSGIPGVGTLLGQWTPNTGIITITYDTLVGGTFSVGDTVTEAVNGAIGTVLTDDGVGVMTLTKTTPYNLFVAGNTIDNGLGVSANELTVSAAAVTIGDVSIYDGNHYVNLTGVAGTAPSGDAVNWDPVVRGVTTGYIQTADSIAYDLVSDIITRRSDVTGNEMYNYGGVDSISVFQWGHIDVYGNKAEVGCILNCLNNVGEINRNTLLSGGNILANTNYAEIAQNTVSSGSTITATTNRGEVLFNNLSGLATINATSNLGTISGNTVSSLGDISASDNTGDIYHNTVSNQAFIIASNNANAVSYNNLNNLSALDATSNEGDVSNNDLRNTGSLVATNNTGDVKDNELHSAGLLDAQFNTGIITYNTVLSSGIFTATNNDGAITKCTVGRGANVTAEMNVGVTLESCSWDTPEFSIAMDPLVDFTNKSIRTGYSDFNIDIDMSDVNFFSAGTLTLDGLGDNKHIGVFTLVNNDAQTISEIENIQGNHKVRFYVEDGNTQNFQHTAIALAAVKHMVCDAGAVSNAIVGRSDGADFIEYEKSAGLNRRYNIVKLS